MPPLWYGNIQVFSTLDTNFMAVQENLPPGATIGPSVFP